MRNQEPPQWNIKVPVFFYWNRTQEGEIGLCICCCLYADEPSQERGNTKRIGGLWTDDSVLVPSLRWWKKYTVTGIRMVKATSSTLISLFIYRIIFQHMYAKCTYTANWVMGNVILISLLGKNLRPSKALSWRSTMAALLFSKAAEKCFGFARSIPTTFLKGKKSYKPQSKTRAYVFRLPMKLGTLLQSPWDIPKKLTLLKGKSTYSQPGT